MRTPAYGRVTGEQVSVDREKRATPGDWRGYVHDDILSIFGVVHVTTELLYLSL